MSLELTGRFLGDYIGAYKQDEPRTASRGRRKRNSQVQGWLDLLPSPYEPDDINERICGGIKMACYYTAPDESVIDDALKFIEERLL